MDKHIPDLSFETRHARLGPVCGVDEVGRGPWAGPVVAVAVILPDTLPQGLNDSKKLTAKRREALYDGLVETCDWGLGEASVEEIDSLNIRQATFLAMRRAVEGLTQSPAFALIDGRDVPEGLPCEGEAIIKGDGRSLSISAASIIAKVWRDRLMADLAETYPHYGWEKNAGYGTKLHQAGLAKYGVTPHHRRSFKPIHNMLCEENSVSR